MTYNQSAFILDALNGFSMQRTDFPFVCLVMDDASTDGESEVIRSYIEKECDVEQAQYDEIEEANIVIIPHKANRNCTFAFYFLKKNLYRTGKKQPLVKEWEDNCKYIAMCEGDDFWIDSLKLQRQVDALEAHQDCVMSATGCRMSKDGIMIENAPKYNHETVVPLQNIIMCGPGHVRTATFLYRKDIFDKYPNECKSCCIGDWPLAIYCGILGGIYYIPEIMAEYRFQTVGSYTAMNRDSQVMPAIKRERQMVEMLCSLDRLSELQYTYYFHRAEAKGVYDLIRRYKKNAEEIVEHFQDVSKYFVRIEKISIFLFRHKMFSVYGFLQKSHNLIKKLCRK